MQSELRPPAQSRLKVKPDAGTPSARTPKSCVPVAGILPARRLRKRLVVLGAEKARVNVARRFWLSVGLKTSATRGENTLLASRLWLSRRAAETSSNIGVR